MINPNPDGSYTLPKKFGNVWVAELEKALRKAKRRLIKNYDLIAQLTTAANLYYSDGTISMLEEWND
jgi:hypothetical protein